MWRQLAAEEQRRTRARAQAQGSACGRRPGPRSSAEQVPTLGLIMDNAPSSCHQGQTA